MHGLRIAFLFFVIFLALPVQGQEGIENLRQIGKAFTAVARQVSPSVVYVQVEGTREQMLQPPFSFPFGEQWPFGEDFFKRFFGEPAPDTPPGEAPKQRFRTVSQGSGFVFDPQTETPSDKSYILTNNHVVEGADKISVTFQNGREYDAKVKGSDPSSDVAVLEVQAADLPSLQWGDSSTLEVGEWVVAIGNPFGLSHTLTVGVVSATGRTSLGISDYEDFIQTDAAINPGNSGGPMVNLTGEVVGMNTAIFSRSGGYMGVGFAIPSNLTRLIAEQLIETGEVVRGYLGIVIQTLTSELAKSFGLAQTRGILISQVTDNSPAAKAGLKQGDVIVSFQGEPVSDVGDFRNRVSLTPPGSQATLVIYRNGERQEITATIGELGQAQTQARSPVQKSEELGLSVQTVTEELAKQFNIKAGEGVVVTQIRAGSIAALSGIKPGDVILQVNRKPVNNTEEFHRAVSQTLDEKRVLLLIRSGETQHYVVLNW